MAEKRIIMRLRFENNRLYKFYRNGTISIEIRNVITKEIDEKIEELKRQINKEVEKDEITLSKEIRKLQKLFPRKLRWIKTLRHRSIDYGKINYENYLYVKEVIKRYYEKNKDEIEEKDLIIRQNNLFASINNDGSNPKNISIVLFLGIFINIISNKIYDFLYEVYNIFIGQKELIQKIIETFKEGLVNYNLYAMLKSSGLFIILIILSLWFIGFFIFCFMVLIFYIIKIFTILNTSKYENDLDTYELAIIGEILKGKYKIDKENEIEYCAYKIEAYENEIEYFKEKIKECEKS